MSAPPPPQGPNPYQQPQQPQPPQAGYGFPQQQPQPPQAGYGFPQQQPQPPGGYPTPQPGYPQQPGFPQQGGYPVAPAKKPRTRLFASLGVLAVLIVGAIVASTLNSDDSQTVKAGDCVQNTGTDDKPNLKQVTCANSQDVYKVLKKVPGSSDGQTTCQGVSGADTYFTETENGDSFVLCLKQQ